MRKILMSAIIALFISLNFTANICDARIRRHVDDFFGTTFIYSIHSVGSLTSTVTGERRITFVKEFDKNGEFNRYFLTISVSLTKGTRGTLAFDHIANIRFPDGQIFDLQLISTEIRAEIVHRYLFGRYALNAEIINKMLEVDGNFQILATSTNNEAGYTGRVHFPNIPQRRFEEWRTIINAQAPDDPILRHRNARDDDHETR